MSQLTKNAIVETTVRLSQSRPINKITVRDIVEACGITRNTFYYHFHDIYEVLECAIEIELSNLREAWGSDPHEALYSLLKFCISYKRVWNNLYRAVGHDQLSVYISKQVKAILGAHIAATPGADRLDQKDLSLISVLCEEMFVGVFFRWLRTDVTPMSDEELHAFSNRVLLLFEGHLQAAIEKCTCSKL